MTDPQTPGSVLWPLTDRLGTVRDLAVYDAQTGVASVANHRLYDSFGNLKSETNAAVDFLFGFTGRPFDENTGLQNNLNRWYDPPVARWLSQDPLGFHAGDINVYRYVGNDPALGVDPTGLWWGWDEWREAIKAFSNELFVNEIYGGAKALVTGEAGRQLGNRCVGIVETQTGKPFTGTTSEWARFGRAVAGDVVGVNQIVEGASGYDISNQQELDAWERARRAAGGTGALAGTAAGGIYAAGKYAPATFPTAAKAAGLTPASTAAPATNPVQGLPRVGSALKTDPYHAFPDIVDNFASGATSTTLRSGATLYQVEGSLNGVAGRFEWIIDNGQVTHRMFVPGGTCNGVPIKP